MSYRSFSGEKDGVQGTWFIEQCTGGPGGYPYEKRHFVADSDRGATDTRKAYRTNKPWEMYRHITVT